MSVLAGFSVSFFFFLFFLPPLSTVPTDIHFNVDSAKAENERNVEGCEALAGAEVRRAT